MLSRGTVHSIGDKEIGCCWSDPSCSIAAVPGPALTLTFSRGQPTVTDRPHCESFNRSNHSSRILCKQNNILIGNTAIGWIVRKYLLCGSSDNDDAALRQCD